MGTKDLRSAFNAVAEPAYSCSVAMLEYDHDERHGKGSQILTFSGRGSDGTAFTVRSRIVRAEEDVNLVAAETAQKMLEQDKP